METVDELMTPGCPQCARKHLSAAIALSALAGHDGGSWDVAAGNVDPCVQVYVARAFVNLVEASEGYASHVAFARGLLVLAEETAPAAIARGIRAVRLALDEEAFDPRTMRKWFCMQAEAAAHELEARRELPGFDWEACVAESGPSPRVRTWEAALAAIDAEYFSFDGGEPDGGKGGEDTMASAKKPAFLGKKADAKKGGKACGKKGCKK